MQYLVVPLVLIVLASLLVERAPAGGVRISRRFTLFVEFMTFIRERKLWWMMPIFIILILLGISLLVFEKSIIIPILYAGIL
jgi:hypothetical protein